MIISDKDNQQMVIVVTIVILIGLSKFQLYFKYVTKLVRTSQPIAPGKLVFISS